jgi:hypothetical protein
MIWANPDYETTQWWRVKLKKKKTTKNSIKLGLTRKLCDHEHKIEIISYKETQVKKFKDQFLINQMRIW